MVAETYKLIEAVKKMYPVVTFFKDRYFPDGPVFYSEKALIETKKGNRKVAPFVIPVVGGIVQAADGYRAEEVRAPYIAPKMPITAEELEKKAFGESPESGRTPAQRENEIQAEHMDEMRQSILRRMELMCTELITKGEVVMKHFATAEDAAKDVNYKTQILRFYENEFKNKYLPLKKWAEMNAQERMQVLYEVARILRRRGVRATDIVMTGDVSKDLLTDREFLNYYDKRFVFTGEIDQKELPEGVACNGTVNVNGVRFTLFTYDEAYEDLDGTVKEFLPKGTIAFLAPRMGRTAYAQVTFVRNGEFHSYAAKMVPRTVADENNNMVEVQMFSRPVMYPLDWDGWMVYNIYDEPAKDQKEADNAHEPDEADEEKRETLKTADEIRALTKKAELISYAESIGLSGLTKDMTLDELKTAILDYQDETYGE